MDLRQFAEKSISESPGCRLHGLKVTAVEKGVNRIELPYADFLCGERNDGVLHGGAVTVLVDTAAGLAASTAIDGFEPVATLDLRVDHLRAAKPGRSLIADARCEAVTRQSVVVRTVTYESGSDEPIAISTGTFMRRSNYNPDSLGSRSETGSDALKLKILPKQLPLSPYGQWLGIGAARSNDSDNDDIETCCLPFSERVIGNPHTQAIHGGVIGAYLEAVALIHLRRLTGQPAKTINVTTSYHNFGGPFGLHARAHVTRRGHRVATVRIESWQKSSSIPTAHLLGHFLLARGDTDSESEPSDTDFLGYRTRQGNMEHDPQH